MSGDLFGNMYTKIYLKLIQSDELSALHAINVFMTTIIPMIKYLTWSMIMALVVIGSLIIRYAHDGFSKKLILAIFILSLLEGFVILGAIVAIQVYNNYIEAVQLDIRYLTNDASINLLRPLLSRMLEPMYHKREVLFNKYWDDMHLVTDGVTITAKISLVIYSITLLVQCGGVIK